MKIPPRPRLLLALLASTWCVACASVKTVPVGGERDAVKVRRPAEIWIRPFATDNGMWQKAAAPMDKRIEIRDWLSGSLLRDLATIAPARLLADEMPTSGWLVTGRFLRVQPGSRLGRMFLGGIGAGASKLETAVDVYDLAVSATQPILSFTTTGGSNLATGLSGAMNATDDDVSRTAREIHDYLEAHLWPAESKEGREVAPAAIGEVKIAPAPRRAR